MSSYITSEAYLSAVAGIKTPIICLIDLDINQELDGRGVAKRVREMHPDATIIIYSGYSHPILRYQLCSTNLADDFIQKGTEDTFLKERLFQVHCTRTSRMKDLQIELADKPLGKTMIGAVYQMPHLLEQKSFFILGEPGTGKGFLLHRFEDFVRTKVKGAPFILVDFEPSIVRQVLFGSATANTSGLFKSAQNGWLVFTQIQKMPLRTQEMLATRLGTENIKVICLNEKHPKALLKEGTLERSLYKYLSQQIIYLPPLRFRPHEIEAFSEHFLEKYKISKSALDLIIESKWKAQNIDELREFLLSIMVKIDGEKPIIEFDDLDSRIWDNLRADPAEQRSPLSPSPILRDDQVTITLDKTKPISFQEYADQLLYGMIKILKPSEKEKTLRSLSKRLGLSRSTLKSFTKRFSPNAKKEKEELKTLLNL